MANAPKRSAAAATAGCDAMTALVNTGYVRIYAVGSGTPSTCAAAVAGDNTVLAEIRLDATAFAAAVNGVAAADVPNMTQEDSATGGTAGFFRILASDGTTCHFQGSCGVANADMILNTVTIGAGTTVSITALSIIEALQP